MSRLLGQSIGISVVAVIFGVVAQGGVTLRGVSMALLFGAGFALVSAAINTARVPHIHPD
jgi:hypothetical protein